MNEKVLRFEIDCMKCNQSMKTNAGSLDDGFIYKCPKCRMEICLTIKLPPLQSIIQQIRKQNNKQDKGGEKKK